MAILIAAISAALIFAGLSLTATDPVTARSERAAVAMEHIRAAETLCAEQGEALVIEFDFEGLPFPKRCAKGAGPVTDGPTADDPQAVGRAKVAA